MTAQLAEFSRKREQGFSLIEVLVALLLFQLVLMVLMHTAVVMTKTNFRNRLRDVGVKVTEEYLERYRNQKFDDLIAGTYSLTVKRTLGNAQYPFGMTVTIQHVTGSNDLITVTILTEWQILGDTFRHTASQVLKR